MQAGRRQVAGVLATLLVALWGATATASPPPPPVDAYAHPPFGAQLELSPDGSHVAFLAPVKGKHHLVIRKLMADGDAKPVLIPPGDFQFAWFAWANDRTLIFDLVGVEGVIVGGLNRRVPVRYNRLLAVERDGTNLRVLYKPKYSPGWYNTTSGRILQFVDDEHVLLNAPDEDTQLVGRLNIYTGKMERLDRDRRWALDILPDPTGQLRLGESLDDKAGTFTLWTRTGPRETFRPLRTWKATEEPGLQFLGFDANDTLYVAAPDGDRDAIFTLDLQTGQLGTRVKAHDRFDVGGAVWRRGAVVAFQYLADMPVRTFLDPNLQSLQEALDRALPDSTEILVDQVAGGRFTVLASHQKDLPTIYRLFDRETRELMPFADTYPHIPEEAIGRREPVSYAARDGLEIPGYLTLPPGREPRKLPFIVMPHGGPIHRDDQTFDPLSQFLVSRGYAVLQPNFRGSSGYGNAFREQGRGEWGGKMQTDVIDGVRWAIDQGIADPDRICIVGWSYGGYSALMGAVQDSGLFKCAIATAPVTNLQRLWRELRWTTSAKQYNRTLFFNGTSDGLEAVSPVHQAHRVDIPVLLIHGDLDAQAFVQHSRDMVDALKKAGKPHEYIEIKGMDHSPATTEQMSTVLSAWERFLKQHIGN